jgi:hypothetical protein
MSPQEFEARIVVWAQKQPHLDALVLGGSRALASNGADEWADWDFHLFTSRPELYQHAGWVEEIAPCWCVNAERTPRGVVKVSAVFENGIEADFVPLKTWQMKLVYAGMLHPDKARWMPRPLVRGIYETRAFMLAAGHRIMAGDLTWEHRFRALQVAWPGVGMQAADFARHVTAFWQQAVWIFKKIIRREPRSAMHALHLLAVDRLYVLLEEEARMAGRTPRSGARKAERWLNAVRLEQTKLITSLDQAVLARALLAEMALFGEVSRSVAASHGFPLPDYSAVEAWLRAELAKVAGPADRG